jgi:hypothetical protein
MNLTQLERIKTELKHERYRFLEERIADWTICKDDVTMNMDKWLFNRLKIMKAKKLMEFRGHKIFEAKQAS